MTYKQLNTVFFHLLMQCVIMVSGVVFIGCMYDQHTRAVFSVRGGSSCDKFVISGQCCEKKRRMVSRNVSEHLCAVKSYGN